MTVTPNEGAKPQPSVSSSELLAGALTLLTKCKIVRARAYQTDEQFGYDRWKADEYSMGLGTHDCLIIVLPVKAS